MPHSQPPPPIVAAGKNQNIVLCNDLYGRNGWLHQELDQAGIVYMAELPEDTQIYLTRPAYGIPHSHPGRGVQPIRQ
jgi:hypothetical protein